MSRLEFCDECLVILAKTEPEYKEDGTPLIRTIAIVPIADGRKGCKHVAP